MPDIVPVQKASKKETFEVLCKDFKIDDHVLKVFDESPIENLEEFRFYFTTEDQVDQFVAQAADLRKEDLRIQIARVRRAWAAVRQGAKKREEGRSVTHSVDLDDLLEETTLHEVKAQRVIRCKPAWRKRVSHTDEFEAF